MNTLLACFAIMIASYTRLSPSPPRANADPLLISRTCNKSDEVQYCEACFNSTTKAAHRDLRGLGGLAIRCAWDQLQTMHGIWGDCYDHQLGDIQSRCDYCIHQFGSSIHYVMLATYAWADKKYVNCTDQLNSASEHVFNCRYSYRDVDRTDDEKKYMKQAGDTTGYLLLVKMQLRQNAAHQLK